MVLSENNNGVGVLLATYNSEAFLREQLKSIICSVPAPAVIIVSDDHSTDATKSILEAIEPECRSKNIQLRVYDNPVSNKGVHGNFRNLLSLGAASEVDIFLLCDHDDIWKDTKIAKSTLALDSLVRGSAATRTRPSLVFTDLEVMNEEGEMISPSFAQFQGLPGPIEHPLERLFHQNVVTGCTTCFNRALLEVATPVPDAVVMHDHWLGLCAKVFGEWHYIDEPLVRYRQHGSNAVGAKRHHRSGRSVWFDPVFLKALAVFPWHFAQSIEQAKALFARVEGRDLHVSEADIQSIREFSRLMSWRLFKRISEGSKWVSMGRGILERTYLNLVFICLPYLRVRKMNDDV